MTRLTKSMLLLCGLFLLSCNNEADLEGSAENTSSADAEVGSTALALEYNETESAITPVADTFIRMFDDDTNYGTNAELRTEGTSLTAYQHTLLRFDSAAITSTVGAHVLVKAELELTISNAAGFIGDGAVTLHRMTMPWTEQGATWDCANDTVTSNFWTDCAPADRWGLDWLDPYPQPYVSQATDLKYVSASQTGTIRFNVTADVASFLANPASNRGWMIKATQEPFIVRVNFRSRTTTAPPRLLITHAIDSCPNDPTKTTPGACGVRDAGH